MKSKQIKKIIASMLTIVTVCGAVNIVPANAAKDIRTAKWAVAKNITTCDTTYDICELTYYGGTIKFRATSMTNSISYLVAKCRGYGNTKISNNKNVSVSRINIDSKFSVDRGENDNKLMRFKVTMDTDATYYQQANAYGKIYY